MSKQALLDEYILSHCTTESPILKELSRQTHLEVLRSRMLSGHLQGQILKLICGMLLPKRILEIGSYTGYSAICFAQGSGEDCIVDTIEIEDELETRILAIIEKAGLSNRINLHIGDSLQIIPTLDHTYDLVFIDGDKREYVAYYNLVFDKVRKGGYILADNVLWDGKVVQPLSPLDGQTKGILEFNDFVTQDSRVECAILPLRDGIFMIKKL